MRSNLLNMCQQDNSLDQAFEEVISDLEEYSYNEAKALLLEEPITWPCVDFSNLEPSITFIESLNLIYLPHMPEHLKALYLGYLEANRTINTNSHECQSHSDILSLIADPKYRETLNNNSILQNLYIKGYRARFAKEQHDFSFINLRKPMTYKLVDLKLLRPSITEKLILGGFRKGYLQAGLVNTQIPQAQLSDLNLVPESYRGQITMLNKWHETAFAAGIARWREEISLSCTKNLSTFSSTNQLATTHCPQQTRIQTTYSRF